MCTLYMFVRSFFMNINDYLLSIGFLFICINLRIISSNVTVLRSSMDCLLVQYRSARGPGSNLPSIPRNPLEVHGPHDLPVALWPPLKESQVLVNFGFQLQQDEVHVSSRVQNRRERGKILVNSAGERERGGDEGHLHEVCQRRVRYLRLWNRYHWLIGTTDSTSQDERCLGHSQRRDSQARRAKFVSWVGQKVRYNFIELQDDRFLQEHGVRGYSSRKGERYRQTGLYLTDDVRVGTAEIWASMTSSLRRLLFRRLRDHVRFLVLCGHEPGDSTEAPHEDRCRSGRLPTQRDHLRKIGQPQVSRCHDQQYCVNVSSRTIYRPRMLDIFQVIGGDQIVRDCHISFLMKLKVLKL